MEEYKFAFGFDFITSDKDNIYCWPKNYDFYNLKYVHCKKRPYLEAYVTIDKFIYFYKSTQTIFALFGRLPYCLEPSNLHLIENTLIYYGAQKASPASSLWIKNVILPDTILDSYKHYNIETNEFHSRNGEIQTVECMNIWNSTYLPDSDTEIDGPTTPGCETLCKIYIIHPQYGLSKNEFTNLFLSCF